MRRKTMKVTKVGDAELLKVCERQDLSENVENDNKAPGARSIYGFAPPS